MKLHQDGSTHEWVPGKCWDPIVTMDEATNEHDSMFCVDEEGTRSRLRGVHVFDRALGGIQSLFPRTISPLVPTSMKSVVSPRCQAPDPKMPARMFPPTQLATRGKTPTYRCVPRWIPSSRARTTGTLETAVTHPHLAGSAGPLASARGGHVEACSLCYGQKAFVAADFQNLAGRLETDANRTARRRLLLPP